MFRILPFLTACLLVQGVYSIEEDICTHGIYKHLVAFAGDSGAASSYCSDHYPIPATTITVFQKSPIDNVRRTATYSPQKSDQPAFSTAACRAGVHRPHHHVTTTSAPSATASSGQIINVQKRGLGYRAKSLLAQVCTCIGYQETVTVQGSSPTNSDGSWDSMVSSTITSDPSTSIDPGDTDYSGDNSTDTSSSDTSTSDPNDSSVQFTTTDPSDLTSTASGDDAANTDSSTITFSDDGQSRTTTSASVPSDTDMSGVDPTDPDASVTTSTNSTDPSTITTDPTDSSTTTTDSTDPNTTISDSVPSDTSVSSSDSSDSSSTGSDQSSMTTISLEYVTQSTDAPSAVTPSDQPASTDDNVPLSSSTDVTSTTDPASIPIPASTADSASTTDQTSVTDASSTDSSPVTSDSATATTTIATLSSDSANKPSSTTALSSSQTTTSTPPDVTCSAGSKGSIGGGCPNGCYCDQSATNGPDDPGVCDNNNGDAGGCSAANPACPDGAICIEYGGIYYCAAYSACLPTGSSRMFARDGPMPGFGYGRMEKRAKIEGYTPIDRGHSKGQ